MTNTEKAWKPIDREWGVYSPIEPESEGLRRLQAALKELQQMRLPISAIDYIGEAVRQAFKAGRES
jgi:hypothetical protein